MDLTVTCLKCKMEWLSGIYYTCPRCGTALVSKSFDTLAG